MLHSNSPQGQVSMRQALTVATMGGRDYMKRCHDKMRSELPKYDGIYSGNLSSTFILLDRSIAVIEMQKIKSPHGRPYCLPLMFAVVTLVLLTDF